MVVLSRIKLAAKCIPTIISSDGVTEPRRRDSKVYMVTETGKVRFTHNTFRFFFYFVNMFLFWIGKPLECLVTLGLVEPSIFYLETNINLNF
jgi:hypothetical protein